MPRLVGDTPKGAEHRRSCRLLEALSRFMPENHWALLLASHRDRERERGMSPSFAKWRMTVLQRRKNTVLGRQFPLDVALRFAAPLVA